ncbi:MULTISPECIES: DUF5683 domain-containing protein [Chryseobacterium]|uniref:DUF5683 domain-containing protein n=3 Tax=Chryseobacterium TaxID=59732 RepID=A0A202BM56_9FLAO|nr:MULTISPECIES: DUF5683 domain-containing protein [Chryseobacterium]MBL7879586.1 hypothetical protein [Chryseobacterium gambrini]MCY1660884.1 DUF5683 domain-containing protein [Chryseobacterium sp. SL1]MDO3426748.1 DUF5683 domain-containing protein [Chryseobacterium sp. APV1]OVE52564.1 hypothetical protein B0E34_20825 [Chryseobacterium mucoviscidosis]PTT74353.1 hypothetical protein DBR25_11025 [Chryseobacterium sp. HMWF001]
MKKILFTFFLCLFAVAYSQVNPNDTIRVDYRPKDSVAVEKNNTKTEAKVVADLEKANGPTKKTLKLNPTKAGLYSAVLPGLGQVYNKKYWKVPIVLGAVGAGVGIAVWNDNQYRKYREYYIAKLNGTPNEFVDTHPWLDKVALGNAQDRSKRQRDYAIAITGLIYILNIVDAVVDAHLYEARHDPDLTLNPAMIQDQYGIAPPKTGLSLSYRF